jgi:hypothetical protein
MRAEVVEVVYAPESRDSVIKLLKHTPALKPQAKVFNSHILLRDIGQTVGLRNRGNRADGTRKNYSLRKSNHAVVNLKRLDLKGGRCSYFEEQAALLKASCNVTSDLRRGRSTSSALQHDP